MRNWNWISGNTKNIWTSKIRQERTLLFSQMIPNGKCIIWKRWTRSKSTVHIMWCWDWAPWLPEVLQATINSFPSRVILVLQHIQNSLGRSKTACPLSSVSNKFQDKNVREVAHSRTYWKDVQGPCPSVLIDKKILHSIFLVQKEVVHSSSVLQSKMTTFSCTLEIMSHSDHEKVEVKDELFTGHNGVKQAKITSTKSIREKCTEDSKLWSSVFMSTLSLIY